MNIAHAIAGYSNPQTMWVSDFIELQPMTVLIDTHSTSTFMDIDTAT